jgi:hypothetical protein
MRIVEIDLMRVTGRKNIKVCVDNDDALAFVDFVDDYKRVVDELEFYKEKLIKNGLIGRKEEA